MHTMRTRSALWLAAAAALALTAVWATAAWQVGAAPTPDESTVVNVAPERVLDTRDPTDLGLPGPFTSPMAQKLKITGMVATATGMKTVIPDGATGALLNVTSINSTADGFVSIRPGDTTGAPTTSSLNFLAGSTTPNAVQVQLPTTGPNAGQIDITYDALGIAGPTSDIFIDVVGYTKNSGLMDLITEKANVADVYTKTQADARYVPQAGEVKMTHSPYYEQLDSVPPSGGAQQAINATRATGGDGSVMLQLTGPATLGSTDYGLKSVRYCIRTRMAPAFVDQVRVVGIRDDGTTNVASDPADQVSGCHTVTANIGDGTSYQLVVDFGGAGGWVSLTSATSIWAPASSLTPRPAAADVDLSGIES